MTCRNDRHLCPRQLGLILGLRPAIERRRYFVTAYEMVISSMAGLKIIHVIKRDPWHVFFLWQNKASATERRRGMLGALFLYDFYLSLPE